MSKSSPSPLLEADDPSDNLPAVRPPEPESGLVQMIAGLAANPDVDVAKLEKLIDMQERILRHNAKAAFDGAFSRMQAEIPEIDERGRITAKGGGTRSTYAKLEDIHKAIKPILAKHGFAIRHRTEWPEDKAGIIRIIGILSHESGHSESSVFEAPMDRSEYRTDIQSMGSTVSYGRRYTTMDLLNISTRGVDDDGRTAGRQQPPEKYDDWVKKMRQAAEGGMPTWEPAWACSDAELKTYMANHDRETMKALKETAASVRAAARPAR